MSDITIRAATSQDIPILLKYIEALASELNFVDRYCAKAEQLERYLFANNPIAFALVAQSENIPAGFALYYTTFSTFTSSPSLYLEDIYIEKSKRHQGFAKALFSALSRIAVANDCCSIKWSMPKDNLTGKAFYEHMGGKTIQGWSTWELTAPQLASLAQYDRWDALQQTHLPLMED